VDGKLGLLPYELGQIIDWSSDRANLYHGYAFQHLADGLKEKMVVLADQGFANGD